MMAAFGAAAIVSYVTIAKYQQSVASSWYLVGSYPPPIDGNVAHSLGWLVTSLRDYVGAQFGGYYTTAPDYIGAPLAGYDTWALFVFLIVVPLSRFALEPARLRQEPLLLLFVVLVGGSIAAALLRIYPFGAIRQQLYAAPIVILAAVRANALLWSQFDIRWRRLALAGMAAIVLAASAMRIPTMYGEREDIRSALTIGLQGVDPTNIFVYYGAISAVDFHYPDSGFKRGTWTMRGHIALMADQAIQAASGQKLYLLFSHIYSNEDELLIAKLRAHGWILVRDERYTGARAVFLNQPRLSDRDDRSK